MLIALPLGEWTCFAQMPWATFTASLSAIAANMDPRIDRKSVRGPKTAKPEPKHKRHAVHLSTKQILEKRA